MANMCITDTSWQKRHSLCPIHESTVLVRGTVKSTISHAVHKIVEDEGQSKSCRLRDGLTNIIKSKRVAIEN